VFCGPPFFVAATWVKAQAKYRGPHLQPAAPLRATNELLEPVNPDAAFGWHNEVLATATCALGLPPYLEYVREREQFLSGGWGKSQATDDQLREAARVYPPDAEETSKMDLTLASLEGCNVATDDQRRDGKHALPIPSEFRKAPLQSNISAGSRAKLRGDDRTKVQTREIAATANNREFVRSLVGMEVCFRFHDSLRREVEQLGEEIRAAGSTDEAYEKFLARVTDAPTEENNGSLLYRISSGEETSVQTAMRVAAYRARGRMVKNWSEIVRMIIPDVPAPQDSRKRKEMSQADIDGAAATKRAAKDLAGRNDRPFTNKHGRSGGGNRRIKHGDRRNGGNSRGRGGGRAGENHNHYSGKKWGRGSWNEKPGSSNGYGNWQEAPDGNDDWQQDSHADQGNAPVHQRLGGKGGKGGKGGGYQARGRGNGRGRGRGRGR